MLAIISDIHFQDTANDTFRDKKGDLVGDIDRNVPLDAFRMAFHEIIAAAREDKAKELVIVLAGDIFEINRSQKWLRGSERPYGVHPASQWGPIACEIFDDIARSNRETFELFRTLSRDRKVVLADGTSVSLPEGVPFRFEYITGNHDRAANLYKPLRKKIIDALGMVRDHAQKFDNVIDAREYGLFIRHGHEYDPFNFGGQVALGQGSYDVEDYNRAPLGDYVTIDVAAKLAHDYRAMYYDEMFNCGMDAAIHKATYAKLLEFDDLRPSSDLMEFLDSEITDTERARRFLDPVLQGALKEALESEFVAGWLNKLQKPDALLALMTNRFTRRLINWAAGKIPGLVRAALGEISSATPANETPQEYALNEPKLDDPGYRYVVSGHTHFPETVFLQKVEESGRELFYFNTGTWRQQIRRCLDEVSFARAKALTYVYFYRNDEDPPKPDTGRPKGYSFDYWTGFTKKEA